MKEQEILKKCLLGIVENLDCGNSHLSGEECLDIVSKINEATNAKNKLSKYQASTYLGVSRSTFDKLIKDGKIPEGRKEQGFKELFWYKGDLKKCRK